jgi:hypothetical protein
MVIQAGFRVELVEAKTKKPYKEHTSKDGKVYVEAEPDAEYFVSVQKITKISEKHCLYVPYVDDQSLGWQGKAAGEGIATKPTYFGLCQDAQGVLSSIALKFVKPSYVNRNDSKNSSPPTQLFGKVEVKVYEAGAAYDNKKIMHQDTSVSLSRPTVAVGNAGNETKKNLRSSEGCEILRGMGRKTGAQWKRKGIIDVITLNYCSAVGLINVGVLVKPDIYAWHRMTNPGKRRTAAMDDTPIVPPKRICTSSTVKIDEKATIKKEQQRDLFDLSELPSDDE